MPPRAIIPREGGASTSSASPGNSEFLVEMDEMFRLVTTQQNFQGMETTGAVEIGEGATMAMLGNGGLCNLEHAVIAVSRCLRQCSLPPDNAGDI